MDRIELPARKIMKKLSMTPSALAKRLKLGRSTVCRWTYEKSRGGTGGLIPYKYHDKIKMLAGADNVTLSPSDFLL